MYVHTRETMYSRSSSTLEQVLQNLQNKLTSYTVINKYLNTFIRRNEERGRDAVRAAAS